MSSEQKNETKNGFTSLFNHIEQFVGVSQELHVCSGTPPLGAVLLDAFPPPRRVLLRDGQNLTFAEAQLVWSVGSVVEHGTSLRGGEKRKKNVENQT